MSDDTRDGDESNVFSMIPGGGGSGSSTEEEKSKAQVVEEYLQDPINYSSVALGMTTASMTETMGPTYTVGILIMQAIKVSSIYSIYGDTPDGKERLKEELIKLIESSFDDLIP